jgi:4-methyl-5(b-hydroxyethyl)-thiazole monophosphate biosynthesis
MIRVALLLAEGFEEAEAITPVDLLRRAGIDCVTVSLAEEKLVPSSRRIPVLADRSWDEMDFDGCDGVVLPGGLSGTERLTADARVEALLRRYGESGKLTAAICAAPTVLAKAGLLAGRRAICYPGLEDRLTGAEVCCESVVRDGTVITSRGMGTSVPFGLALVEYFLGKDKADTLAAKIVYNREA